MQGVRVTALLHPNVFSRGRSRLHLSFVLAQVNGKMQGVRVTALFYGLVYTHWAPSGERKKALKNDGPVYPPYRLARERKKALKQCKRLFVVAWNVSPPSLSVVRETDPSTPAVTGTSATDRSKENT